MPGEYFSRLKHANRVVELYIMGWFTKDPWQRQETDVQ